MTPLPRYVVLLCDSTPPIVHPHHERALAWHDYVVQRRIRKPNARRHVRLAQLTYTHEEQA